LSFFVRPSRQKWATPFRLCSCRRSGRAAPSPDRSPISRRKQALTIRAVLRVKGFSDARSVEARMSEAL
jgi:hypothetical protein